jgi:PDZ domain
MSGPKHLWSGDWENESAAASDDPAGRRVTPTDPAPAAQPAPAARPAAARPAPAAQPAPAVPPSPRPVPAAPPAPRTRVRRRPAPPSRLALSRRLLIVAAAVLVIAAAAYGVTTLFGGSGSPATAGGLTGQPAAAGSTGPISWLGMEIQTVPPGVAVIETVKLGSQGDRAGLEPGDVILQVNNRPIDSAGDIAGAIRGLHSGDQVPLQISQGSALSQTEATLAAPPAAYP